jgi:hypothetical protein
METERNGSMKHACPLDERLSRDTCLNRKLSMLAVAAITVHNYDSARPSLLPVQRAVIIRIPARRGIFMNKHHRRQRRKVEEK